MLANDEVFDVRILDFRARVFGPAPLLRDLSTLYPIAPAETQSDGARLSTLIHVQPNAHDPARLEIIQDGNSVLCVPSADLLPHVEWVINTAAVSQLSRQYLLLHAGAVAYGDTGLILCAKSGSGKTTLTAGLVAAGCQYFSDEVAAIQPSSRRLMPFPRSLCIKQGSRAALARLYPELTERAPIRRFADELVWYVTPPARSWSPQSVSVKYIVMPSFASEAVNELQHISRSATLPHLIAQCFSAPLLGSTGVGTIVALLQEAECYRLKFSDLSKATAQLLELLRL